jgi:hypothetical protein
VVINPLTMFSHELEQQWAPLLTGGDYQLGFDSESLGYYMITEIQP